MVAESGHPSPVDPSSYFHGHRLEACIPGQGQGLSDSAVDVFGSSSGCEDQHF